MPRDAKIQRAFEISDDGMQGIVGYFHYVVACQKNVKQADVIMGLPASPIQITYEWGRNYDPRELCHVMQKVFQFYHARTALISLISIFEAALREFVDRLVETGKIRKPQKENYKSRLEWAFSLAKKTTYGTEAMRQRIPDLCLDIDHARRIRNLWMHSNGLFDEEYAKGINVDGRNPIIVLEFSEWLKGKKEPTSFVLNPKAFLNISFSHVELLHHLHDTIQRDYFGQKVPYEYGAAHKKIEWQRLLLGV